MRARIVKPCTLVCGPGSIVEVTQDQLLALGDAAVALDKKGVSNLDTDPKKTTTPKKDTKPKKGAKAQKE